MQIMVDIAGYKISQCESDTLITYSLGSCIGMTLYDPIQKIGGMVHCMLPHSKIDPGKAYLRPGMFVNTGLGILLNDLFKFGATRKTLIAKLAGASNILDNNNLFNIGQRNYSAAVKMLQQNEINIYGENVGGSHSRTMFMYLRDGRTIIRANGRDIEL